MVSNNFGKKIRDEAKKRLEQRGLRKRNARPQLDGGAGLSSRRNGTPGPPGQGVPPGGAPDQVLTKRTATNFDTEWRDPIAGGGGVTREYVDAQDALRMLKTGDAMSGDLTVNGSSSSDQTNLTVCWPFRRQCYRRR